MQGNRITSSSTSVQHSNLYCIIRRWVLHSILLNLLLLLFGDRFCTCTCTSVLFSFFVYFISYQYFVLLRSCTCLSCNSCLMFVMYIAVAVMGIYAVPFWASFLFERFLIFDTLYSRTCMYDCLCWVVRWFVQCGS